MKFSVYQVSRRGGRQNNEDRLGYTFTREAVLLVLADGMGGHPEGEKAAELAVDVFVQQFVQHAQPALADPVAFLQDTVMLASQTIVDYARAQAMKDNPRTTLVAAVCQNHQLTALHSGDSRLYWVRGGRLIERTRDHSYHDKPELFPHANTAVNRSVLFTCLGSDTDPLFDITGPHALTEGDRILLCSDGLWSVVGDDEVAAGLHGLPLQDAIGQLAEEAVLKGGRHGDNVSLIALEWEGAGEFPSTQVITPAAWAKDAAPVDADVPAASLDAFDDEAIERSIAEIREAIERTAARHNRPSSS